MLLCYVIEFINLIIVYWFKRLIWMCYNLEDIFYVSMNQPFMIWFPKFSFILKIWKTKKQNLLRKTIFTNNKFQK